MLPPQVQVVVIENNDAWMRDCGPTFVIGKNGSVRGIDWIFNAWGGLMGGLYYPWDLDDAVPQKVLEMEGWIATVPRSSWKAARSTWMVRGR